MLKAASHLRAQENCLSSLTGNNFHSAVKKNKSKEECGLRQRPQLWESKLASQLWSIESFHKQILLMMDDNISKYSGTYIGTGSL